MSQLVGELYGDRKFDRRTKPEAALFEELTGTVTDRELSEKFILVCGSVAGTFHL